MVFTIPRTRRQAYFMSPSEVLAALRWRAVDYIHAAVAMISRTSLFPSSTVTLCRGEELAARGTTVTLCEFALTLPALAQIARLHLEP
jgi:hypothetical protein